jgi:uncharacterized protein
VRDGVRSHTRNDPDAVWHEVLPLWNAAKRRGDEEAGARALLRSATLAQDAGQDQMGGQGVLGRLRRRAADRRQPATGVVGQQVSNGLTVEVTEGLTPEWPALAVAGPLFATPGWLRAMDGRLGDRPVTIVVRRDGRATLAAFASVQATHRPGELFDLHQVLVHPGQDLPLAQRSRERRAGLAASGPLPQRWQPSLVVMLPGYECTPVGPDAHDRAAATALVDGALRWAAGQGIATVAMLYVRPEAAVLAAALARGGFVELPLTPTWELRLPGAELSDYVAKLPHKRRIEARRELRLLDEAGVRIEPVDADAVFDDLVRLRCQLVAKYRGRERDPEVERVKLRRIIDDVAGGRPHVLLATASGIVLGFALFAKHRGGWHCLAVGSDYADPRSRLTYFGTAYYRAAELAYRCGVRTIGYGLGAWQAKRARGCQATPLTGWVHTTDAELAATLLASARITELVG